MNEKMEMTNKEILKSYNEAKNKGHQIDILSDLNCCPKTKIIDILIEEGVDPRAFARYKGANNIKRVKSEVKVYEKKRRIADEAAIIDEAVLVLWDKLAEEYNTLKAEWENISAEYERKLSIIDRMMDGKKADK